MESLLSSDPAPEKDPWSALPHDMCSCSQCGWEGPVKSCKLERDSEGWEYPDYFYHVCPVCELGGDVGEIDTYWSSVLAAFEEAREDVQQTNEGVPT